MMDLSELDKIEIGIGKHERRNQGMCAMEAAAYLAGEPHSDRPMCVCPILAAYTRAMNDRLDFEKRQLLKKYIPRMIGTNNDGYAERRMMVIIDWLMENGHDEEIKRRYTDIQWIAYLALKCGRGFTLLDRLMRVSTKSKNEEELWNAPDWTCPKCVFRNLAIRRKCRNCNYRMDAVGDERKRRDVGIKEIAMTSEEARIYAERDEETRVYLERRIWPKGPVCPRCQSGERVSALGVCATRKPGFYRCRACALDFTVRSGTVFWRSKIPLRKLVCAIHFVATEQDVTCARLAKEIEVSCKTAWLILRRLREACGGGGMPKNPDLATDAVLAYRPKPQRRRIGRKANR